MYMKARKNPYFKNLPTKNKPHGLFFYLVSCCINLFEYIFESFIFSFSFYLQIIP